MLSKQIIAIVLLTILALNSCQISPLNHKPILLDLNHDTNNNNLSLRFNIKEDGTSITLFRGYSFLIKLPSLASTTPSSCSLTTSSGVSLGQFTASYKADTKILACTYTDSNANSLTGVSLSSDLTLTISGININTSTTSTIDEVSIGLYTTNSQDGTLIVQIPAFRALTLYSDYKEMTNAAITISEVSVSNLTKSFSCLTTTCTQLYPYSDYSISFDVSINSYIDTEQSYIWIRLNGESIPDSLTITSTAIKDTNKILESRLRSSSTSGELTLTKISAGSFTITNINKYIDSTAQTKILNLIPGRKFTLTIKGFNTKNSVNTQALSKIEILASYKNTESYFSYTTKSVASSLIYPLNFNSAISGSELDITSSVYHSDGTEIYENGSYPLTFKIRIPGVEAGKLRITSVSTANTIFSLVASTCDFSDDTSFANTFGDRPVCIPTYKGYSADNQLIRTISTPSSTTTNDTAVEIKFSQISYQRDLTLNIWGYANKCTDFNGTNYINSVFTTNDSGYFPLKFKYEYIVNNNVVAEKTVISKIKCYKNIRLDSDSYSKINANNNSSVGGFDNNSSIDSLVYQELSLWNPLTTGLYTAAVGVNLESLKHDDGYELSSLSEISNTDTFFALYSSNYDAIDSFALPYTPAITTSEGGQSYYCSDLVPGRIVLNIPEYISNTATTSSNCILAFHSNSENDTTIFQYGTDKTAKNYFNLNNRVLTTNLVNSSGENSIYALNYQDYDSQNFGFYTNCFTYKSYSTLTIKSIYQHVSFFLKYERNISNDNSKPIYKTNRVNRFFKLFNGLTYGFRSDNISDTTENIFTVYKPSILNTSVDNLCILQINQEIFGSLKETTNTLLITMLNQRLVQAGDYDNNDHYPISSVKTGVNSFPLYTEDIINFNYDFSISNRSQEDIDNGYFYDIFEFSNINIFFGNSIVFTGISNSNINTEAENTNPIYTTIPCHVPGLFGGTSIFIVQGFNIDANGIINNSDNVLLTNHSFPIYASPVNFYSNESFGKTLDLNFQNYRSTDENNDILKASNHNDLIYISALLLVNNIETTSTDNSEFFGNNYVNGHYTSIKINGKSYSEYFFSISNTGEGDNISYSINFLKRPNMLDYYNINQNQDMRIKIHGLGIYQTNSMYNYYTNNDSSAIVSSTDLPELINTNETDDLYFTISSSDTVYAGDFGANIMIVANIYSDITSTGDLTINSDSFTSNTKCVRTDNVNQECSYSSNSIKCQNITVTSSIYSTASFSCYNVRIISSTVTIKQTSNFVEINKLLTVTASSSNFINFGATAPLININTITPTVSNISYVQATNKGGLANAFIQINLGRTYRLGQTVKLTADIDSMYTTSTPKCSFMLISTIANLDTLKFNNNVSNGSAFVDSCTITSTNGTSIISLMTRSYVPSSSTNLSQYILIKLSPVYVTDLSVIKYSISTYLKTESDIISSSAPQGNDRMNLPSSNITSSLYTITATPTNALCNLNEVFPRIPSTIGHLTFKIALDKTAELLTTINTVNDVPNVTSKVLNEISIFMDPSIYMRNENIWCSYNSINIPCTWTQQGYINAEFSFNLVDGEYDITIKGVTIPSIASGKNDSNFNCSVNYFNQDSRENLIVGLGTSTIYTYTPTTAGNIIQFTSPNGMASTSVPRSSGTFNFRMNIDNTLGLTELPQTLKSTTTGNNPTILVGFPSEYDFSNIGTVTATLSLTKRSTEIVKDENGTTLYTYTSFSDASTVELSAVEVKGNFIIITLSGLIEVTSEVAYFDLSLNNINTPWITVNGSLINIFMLDELTKPTMIFSTIPNLNNSMGNKLSLNSFNDFYQGPSFSFSDTTKALINTNSSSYSLKPGRYMPINFTVVPGANANASTTLSLATNATIKSLQSSISLNTGLTKTGTLSLGVSCNTLPGSYWASFSSTATTGFYGLSPIRVVVTPVTGNKGSLFVNSMINTLGSINSYNLINGGYARAYINTQFPVVDSLNISFSVPTTATNDAGFTRFSADGTEDIAAGKISSQFSYTITSNKTEFTTQQITLTSGSRCFGFESTTSPSVTITYNIEGTLADLSNVNIASMFLYDASNDRKNEFDLLFTPIANTNAVFALVCADSEYPTYATATSDSISNLDSTLYKFQYGTYTDTKQTTISFLGLKRGTSYKLKVWLSNFGVTDNSLVSYETNSVVSSTNSADMIELKTSEISTNFFLKFTFGSAQSDAFNERLLLNTQKHINSNSNGAKIFVARSIKDATSVYAHGYGLETIETCSATYFTDNYGDTQSETDSNGTSLDSATDTTTPEAAASTLRYLQDSNQSFYFIFKQSAYDSLSVDMDALITKYEGEISNQEKLKSFVESEGISLTGDYTPPTRIEDADIKASDFDLKEISYDKTTGNISLIPVGSYDITCDWKLNDNETTMTSEQILDCATDSKTCGTIAFIKDNTEATILNVGELSAGSYYINVICSSSIPESTKQVIFQNSDALTVEAEIETSSSSLPDCEANPIAEGCNRSFLVQMNIVILLILTLVFLDV